MLKRVSGSVEMSANLARSSVAAQAAWRHDPYARCEREIQSVIDECDKLERHYWVVRYNQSRSLPVLCGKTNCFERAAKLIIVNCHGVMVEVAACSKHKSNHGCRLDRF